MKRLIFMFIYLLVTPLCKAADDQEVLPVRHLVDQVDQPADQPGEQMAGPGQIAAIPEHFNLPPLGHAQIENIPAHLNLPPPGIMVNLANKGLFNIPDNLDPNSLWALHLRDNHIEHVDPQIFDEFPRLILLNLDKNPVTPENVAQLRAAAQQTGRAITIIADDIGEQYSYGGAMKPAKG